MNPLNKTEGLGPGGELKSLARALKNQRTHPAGFSPPESSKAVEDQKAKPYLWGKLEVRNRDARWRVPAGHERSPPPLAPIVVTCTTGYR